MPMLLWAWPGSWLCCRCNLIATAKCSQSDADGGGGLHDLAQTIGQLALRLCGSEPLSSAFSRRHEVRDNSDNSAKQPL